MGVNLANYDNRGYRPGGGRLKRILWYTVNALVFHSWLVPSSGLKCRILRAFGAKIGNGVVIKPRVNIKYPWRLRTGDHVWIGEGAWIDNLADVQIGSNVCISQDAYLLTGNHDYKDPAFSLITGEIVIGDGVWIGARAVICPGVTLGKNSVVTVGSILTDNTLPSGIYSGNRAAWVRERVVRDKHGQRILT